MASDLCSHVGPPSIGWCAKKSDQRGPGGPSCFFRCERSRGISIMKYHVFYRLYNTIYLLWYCISAGYLILCILLLYKCCHMPDAGQSSKLGKCLFDPSTLQNDEDQNHYIDGLSFTLPSHPTLDMYVFTGPSFLAIFLFATLFATKRNGFFIFFSI